jgi:hypothetical protein
MTTVIEPAFNMRWMLPVWVVMIGSPTPIHGAREGLLCLKRHWPERPDAKHRLAEKACRRALVGTQAQHEARSAFIAACKSANILCWQLAAS